MFGTMQLTYRSYAILQNKLGKELARKGYEWFCTVDIAIRRDLKAPVAYIVDNRATWDK